MMYNRDELTVLRRPDSILISVWSKGRCGIWEQGEMIITIPQIKCGSQERGTMPLLPSSVSALLVATVLGPVS